MHPAQAPNKFLHPLTLVLLFLTSQEIIIMNAIKSSIALAIFAAASFGAHAATESAKLELRGSVAVNCTIDVKPTAKATSLDILKGEKEALVGVITESCNSG
jgi:hypothetical protein